MPADVAHPVPRIGGASRGGRTWPRTVALFVALVLLVALECLLIFGLQVWFEWSMASCTHTASSTAKLKLRLEQTGLAVVGVAPWLLLAWRFPGVRRASVVAAAVVALLALPPLLWLVTNAEPQGFCIEW